MKSRQEKKKGEGEKVMNLLTNDAGFLNFLFAMIVSHFCQSKRSMNASRATPPKSTR